MDLPRAVIKRPARESQVVREVDIVLAHRPPLTAEMTTAYNHILDTLSFPQSAR